MEANFVSLYPISFVVTSPPQSRSEAHLHINNSLTGQTLSISTSSPNPKVTLEYRNLEGEIIKEEIPFENGINHINLSFTTLLSLIPPSGEAKLQVDNRVIKITRSSLIPEELKSLDPLYLQISQDIKEKGTFEVAVVVVLWDASFTGEGYYKTLLEDFVVGRKRPWAEGRDAQNNLYWGAATGLRTILKSNSWKIEKEKTNPVSPLQITTFSKNFTPNAFWKKLGVNKPFKVTISAQAYAANDIERGYAEFVHLTKNEAYRVVGLVTHYIPEGKKVLAEIAAPNQPKGVFIVSCFSAPEFGPLVLRNNLYPLFFSLPTTTAEGYITWPILESVAEGANYQQILERVKNIYPRYQLSKAKPGCNQYLNPSCPNFEKVLLENNNDWDGDGQNNFTDLNPIDPQF